MKKLLWVMGILLSFILLIHGPVFADERNDDVDGSFGVVGFNNVPNFLAFDVLDANGNRAFAFTPQQTYTLQFDLQDPDSVADFKSLEFRLFYVPEGESIEDRYLAANTTTIDGESFVMRWGRVDEAVAGSASLPVFKVISDSAVVADNTTWAIVNSTTPAILMNESSAEFFTFEVSFTVSKVAPQSASGEWYIGFILEDGYIPNESAINTTTHAALTVSNVNPLAAPVTSFNMDFYAEVGVESQSSLLWLDVIAGDGFDGANNVDTLENIRFISNGSYVQNTWADNLWTIPENLDVPLNITSASLSADDLDEPQTFGLAVNTSVDLSNLRRLEPSGVDNRPVKTDVQPDHRTDELGLVMEYAYFVALSESFQNATYNGTVYVSVTNNIHQARLTLSNGTTVNYFTLQEAIDNAANGNTIELFFSQRGNVVLNRPLNINFNGYRIFGSLSMSHSSTLASTFSGAGTITEKLIINTPSASLNSDLNVLGVTEIIAVQQTSFNTSGDLAGGVVFKGPGRINSTIPVNVTVDTTSNVILAGQVGRLNVVREAARISFLGAVAEVDVSAVDASSLNLTLAQSASLGAGVIRNGNTFYNSIQEALDKADAGDTIHVGPGIYEEDLVISTEGLTLEGADNHATHIVGSSSGRSIRIDAGDVTLRGFKISNTSHTFTLNTPVAGSVYASALYIGAIAEGNVVIENNYITNVGSHTVANSVWAIYGELGTNSNAQVTLKNNVISQLSTLYENTSDDRRRFSTRAITFERTGAQINIIDNTINDVAHPTHSKGIHVMSDANIIANTLSDIFTTNRDRGGVTNAIHLFQVTGSNVTITLTGNAISSLEAHGEKNYVQPVHFDVDVSGTDHTIVIEENTLEAFNKTVAEIFRTNTGGPGFRTIEMFVTIFPDGVAKEGLLAIDPVDFLANNTFLFNGESLNAVVDLSTSAGADRGSQPNGVVRPEGLAFNLDQGLGFMTIQSAIDAAFEGDTIVVSPGTYKEELFFVEKQHITLQGSTEGQTIIAPIRTYAVGNNGVTIDRSSNITIRHLTIDGYANPELGNVATFRDGIHYLTAFDNSDNTFEYLTIRNIDRRAFSIFGYTEGIENTVVRHNVIHNVTGEIVGPWNGGIAINFQGTGLIENNIVTQAHHGIIHNSEAPGGEVIIRDNHLSDFKDTVVFGALNQFNVGINAWPRSTEKMIIKNNTIVSSFTRQIGMYLNDFANEAAIINNTLVLSGEYVIGIDILNNKNGGFEVSGNHISVGAYSTALALSTVGTPEFPMEIIGNTLTLLNAQNITSNAYEFEDFFFANQSSREVGLLLSGTNQTKRFKDTEGLEAVYATVENNLIENFFEGIVAVVGEPEEDTSDWLSALVMNQNDITGPNTAITFVTSVPFDMNALLAGNTIVNGTVVNNAIVIIAD